ncbi:YceI family protein [Frigoribacterium sp. 2-23]|uniref:YceI family protein n=1 Tax=Frigoribacterium sp. 2-23 TaxID=3415006 RepID=UPI003C6F7FFF
MKKKKTALSLGVAAVVVVGLGATAAIAGPIFYRDVIVGQPEAAPTVSLTPGTSTLDASKLSGDWTVGSGSKAGYRVDEVLNGTDVTVVGTTDKVTGSVTVDGKNITAATVDVEVGDIKTDSSNRDQYFRNNALEVEQFPTATFTLTQPIEAAVPSDGAVSTMKATGTLTMHGVTKDVTVDLQAALSGDGAQVSGSIPVTFADYGVEAPSLGFVEVQKQGTIEFLVAATPSS